MPEQVQQKEAPPPPAYGRPIREIVTDLSKPVPAQILMQRKQGGKDITYIPWYRAERVLDYYAPGWVFEIKGMQELAQQIVVTVRLGIPAAEGVIWREATGIEDKDLKGYGDIASNACGMALRRAAAYFGLGRYLYEKET